jgi:hypothetical protein
MFSEVITVTHPGKMIFTRWGAWAWAEALPQLTALKALTPGRHWYTTIALLGLRQHAPMFGTDI